MASKSCSNHTTDTNTMTKRPKFDRSKFCVKCKENTGNIVIRHAVYCKNCFMPLLTGKIRRSLEPFINDKGDGSRRRHLKASGNLLIGFSGGLASTVLLDLIHRIYFPDKIEFEKRAELLKGGTAHPRNEMVWQKATVCYVEVSSAFPDMKDKTEDVRATVMKYEPFEFIPLRLEDAFDKQWWAKVGGKPSPGLAIDATNEALFISKLDDLTLDPAQRLRSYLSALPTPTAIPSAIRMFIRLLLLYTARSTNSSHLLLGTNLTSLSITLISSISQGGGFSVKEEVQEEWSTNIAGAEGTLRSVRLLRPLQDIGLKECSFWAWWNECHVIGRDKFPGAKQGIGALTRDFIVGLERDYPSTVSTVARTCSKLVPKAGANGTCALCDRSLQIGVQEWKARISIRSLSDSASPSTAHPSLSDHLCYACHTTLTSRSSKAAPKPNGPLPLPVWVQPYLRRSSLTESSLDVAVREKPKEAGGEIWKCKKVDASEIKGAISEFLLEE